MFQISWRRTNSTQEYPNCSVVYYQNGIPVLFPGKSDRQTAVLKWAIIETFCYLDEPLEVNQGQFEVLLRSFRFLEHNQVKKSIELIAFLLYLNFRALFFIARNSNTTWNYQLYSLLTLVVFITAYPDL